MTERAPWGQFPPVIRNGELKELSQHPEYLPAKSGENAAALALVDRLVRNDTLAQIQHMLDGRQPTLVPVLAVEATGNNKIPLAMAHVIGRHLDLPVEPRIIQADKVARTGKGSDHRLAFSPTFDGPVDAGRDYLVMDDTLTMGGTIASLRGHIVNRGGNVLGASVMTAHEGALHLPVKSGMIDAIEQKHGPAMGQFWQETFGYGIDQLTQGEAGHLRKAPSVDALRTRILAARHAVFSGLDESTELAPSGSAARPRSEDRLASSEIPRALLPYHKAIDRLQERHAPAYELELAVATLDAANDFYRRGELPTPGSNANEIRKAGETLYRQQLDAASPDKAQKKATAVKRTRGRDPGLGM